MPTSMKETLDLFPADAKRRLIYALNAGISHVETGPDNSFIGVNVNSANPRIIIELTSGCWAAGRMRHVQSP